MSARRAIALRHRVCITVGMNAAHHPSPEPSHQVGTRLLFENDRVRVWEMVLRPGEESIHHVHDSDYVFVYITKSKLELIQDGARSETSEQGPGFVQYTDVGSGISHSVKNVGSADHREILVELLGPSRTAQPAEPQTNDRSA